MIKNLPAMQKTQVWSLAQEDSLEKGMTMYSNLLAWRIPWTEEPGGLESMGLQRVGQDWVANTFILGNPWLILERVRSFFFLLNFSASNIDGDAFIFYTQFLNIYIILSSTILI